jgi:MFS transporter, PPP family, 3-phenylpropionic acid transporter
MVRFSLHYFMLFVLMATTFPYFQLFLRARGFSTPQVGYLQGLMALAGVCGPIVVGHLADRLGRRRGLIVACLAVFAALMIPLNATASLALAAVLVAGVGFTGRTTIPLADALASTELPDPAHQYGKVRIWGSIGFVLTLLGIRGAALRWPGLVSEQSSTSMMACMMVAAALCAASALFLPDHHRPAAGLAQRTQRTQRSERVEEHHREGSRSTTSSLRPPRPLREESPLPRAGHLQCPVPIPRDSPPPPAAGHFDLLFCLFLAAGATHQFGMSAYYSFFSLYLTDQFHMDQTAWVWAIGSAAEIPLLFYAGRLVRRFGLRAMLMAATAAVSIRLAIFSQVPAGGLALGGLGLVPPLAIILPTQLLHALCFGLFHAASVEFVRRKVPRQRRGLAMALYASLAVGLPAWLGSSAGGQIVKDWGYGALFATYAAVPLLGLACLALAGRRLNLPAPTGDTP